jgi:uncharacterized membrane protein
MTLGPVQLLVVGFDRPDFEGEVLGELERLRENDAVRVIDLLVVTKDADGVIDRVATGEGVGAVVSAVIGLDDARVEPPTDDEVWSLDEAIPNDSAAVIALIEHRWATGARDAIRAAGGVPVADAWVHPADLVAAGLTDGDADDAR